jgi:hypothetical protein
VIVNITPKGAISKREKAPTPCFSAMELTIRFVEVPTKVQAPPNSDAKDKGINILEGLSPQRRANSMVTGKKIATAAVLFIKADTKATTIIKRKVVQKALLPLKRVIHPAASSKTPVFWSPALSTNMAATETVATFEKPAIPCSGVKMPDAKSTVITRAATTSTLSLSVTKRQMVTTTTTSVKYIAPVISREYTS